MKFDKNCSSFLITFPTSERTFRPKGRGPTRASVRTQASEIKRSESRNALNGKTRVLRQQCDGVEQAKREQSGTLRPASEDVDRRARVSEETQASRGRRGRARGTPAACASADAPVRVSELLRSPQRAEILSKLQTDRENVKGLICFPRRRATWSKITQILRKIGRASRELKC